MCSFVAVYDVLALIGENEHFATNNILATPLEARNEILKNCINYINYEIITVWTDLCEFLI